MRKERSSGGACPSEVGEQLQDCHAWEIDRGE